MSQTAAERQMNAATEEVRMVLDQVVQVRWT